MKYLLLVLTPFLLSWQQKESVDGIIHHATIYTVDEAFSTAEAIAINNGKIVAIGSNSDILDRYTSKTITDAQGKFIYPGFIDAHAHFRNYGLGLQTAQLQGTNSWDEVLERLKAFAATHPEGWITGRGWDQNAWPVKEFPSNETLNKLFPDQPVLLIRVDGHAAIVNNKALQLAGVKAGVTLTGGSVEVKNGKATGILIDNAISLVRRKIPGASDAEKTKGFLAAQENCFAVGLTTVHDCGLDFTDIGLIDSLQKAGNLKMRIYALLSDSKKNYEFIFRTGKIKTNRLQVRAFKLYADGAIGSRGACMLEHYSDRPDWKGFLLSNPAHFDSIASLLHRNDLQVCTHAIGDSANRTILKIYARYLKGKNDLRWRIEHAQILNKADFDYFGKYSIVPSVQPTHATSDMYWAADRIGGERVKGAYAYQQLTQQNGWIPLGTDFPVEDISPFKTFYAAVVRKDAKGWPDNGYQMENALDRRQALRGMTIWAARAGFEEKEKGSLEKGKLADLILLDKDLLTTAPDQLLSIQVISTWVNGERVYNK